MKIKNILISQPKPLVERSQYHKITTNYRINLDFHPFVTIEHIPYTEFCESKIGIKDFTAFVFYSKIAVDHFFMTCADAKIKPSDDWKYFCATDSIALYLQKYIVYRKRKIFFDQSATIEGLVKQLKRFPQEKYLISLSETHKSEIPDALDSANIPYTKAILFRTVGANMNAIIPDINKYDVLLFFSPAGINALKTNFPNFEQGTKIIGVSGDLTAKMAETLGFRVDIKVPNSKFSSIPDALENFLNLNCNVIKGR